MNALNQSEAVAIARDWRQGNPMKFGTPHTTVSAVCNAIRDMHMPRHHDFSQVLAVFASKLKDSGFLSEKVKESVLDQLAELADEIDQDLVNQQARAV
jgi:hypothetical protein